jgi:hypothetical protein
MSKEISTRQKKQGRRKKPELINLLAEKKPNFKIELWS